MSRATATVAALGTSIHSSGSDHILPDPRRMIVALRQVGYSFEQAISDLVDNSINGRASNVLIRFICDDHRIRSCVIADDGEGMSLARMTEAMRFGSAEQTRSGSLGKYGMGLNSSILNSPWGPLDLARSGTLIIWDEIDKLPTGTRGLEKPATHFAVAAGVAPGHVFSSIYRQRVPQNRTGSTKGRGAQHSIYATISGLDPFAYPSSGMPGYPKTFRANLPGIGSIDAELCCFGWCGMIWVRRFRRPAADVSNS